MIPSWTDTRELICATCHTTLAQGMVLSPLVLSDAKEHLTADRLLNRGWVEERDATLTFIRYGWRD